MLTRFGIDFIRWKKNKLFNFNLHISQTNIQKHISGKIDLLSRYCEPKGSKVVFDTCSTDKCNGKDGVNSTSEGTVKGK